MSQATWEIENPPKHILKLADDYATLKFRPKSTGIFIKWAHQFGVVKESKYFSSSGMHRGEWQDHSWYFIESSGKLILVSHPYSGVKNIKSEKILDHFRKDCYPSLENRSRKVFYPLQIVIEEPGPDVSWYYPGECYVVTLVGDMVRVKDADGLIYET